MKLVIYFLAAYISIYKIIPVITALTHKCFYYIKIKNICRKNNYTMISSFKTWIFSSVSKDKPEMFVRTEKAIYSVKNYGFYKTPNYFVFLNKNDIEVQVIRMIFWVGFAFLKNIRTKNINYDEADKYFGEHNLPVISIVLFCPKCAKLIKLEGKSIHSYTDYVNSKSSFKIWGRTILKIRSIIKNPFIGFDSDNAVPNIKGVEIKDLSNGDMIYGAYVYNVKSFVRERLQSSDRLVRSLIEENSRKFETHYTS